MHSSYQNSLSNNFGIISSQICIFVFEFNRGQNLIWNRTHNFAFSNAEKKWLRGMQSRKSATSGKLKNKKKCVVALRREMTEKLWNVASDGNPRIDSAALTPVQAQHSWCSDEQNWATNNGRVSLMSSTPSRRQCCSFCLSLSAAVHHCHRWRPTMYWQTLSAIATTCYFVLTN